MPADEPDLILLRRTADGDFGAFSALVERHQAAVLRVARALSKSTEAAEDVLQETFVSALRGAATFKGEGTARAWLLTITRNAAARQYRRRAGEPDVYEPLDVLGQQAGWGAQADPEELVARAQEGAVLRAALASLSDGDREVLVLRDVEGLSGEETADALGLSLAAMKSALHRARLRLAAAVRRGGRHGA